MPLQLVQFDLGVDKKKELQGYLRTIFSNTVKARSNQVDDKFRRWMDNYAAKPYEEVRTTPFYRAANFVPQLIRMHTDILHARLYGIVLGTRPFWKPRMVPEGPHEWLDGLAEWMELITFGEMKFHVALDSVLHRAFKQGVCVAKAPWLETTYYLGKPGETKKSHTDEKFSTEGVSFKPIPFDDFFPYPITANNLTECTAKFHRLRFSKEEVTFRKNTNRWTPKSADLLLLGGSAPTVNNETTAHDTQAIDAGIELKKDVTRPYQAVEAWFDYELVPGKMYKLCVTFNPFTESEDGILTYNFNPYPKALDPFIDFRPMPREDLFYGYCVPEILEQAQEEEAQIHNGRRDASSIANVPGWKTKRYADVPNPATEWYPGKVFELNEMTDLEPLQFNGAQYNSMIEEENFLLQLCERYTGASQAMQAGGSGVLQGKRGIYNAGGTLAMLAEGNKRLDIYLKRMREAFHQTGNVIYQSYKTFRPQGAELLVQGARGEAVKKTFSLNEPEGYRGLYFEIGASDGGANREVDRTALLYMSNVMAGYYKQIVEAAGTVVQLPDGNPIREVMLTVLDGAKDLAARVLFAFDVPDRKRLIPDIRQILAGGPGGKGAGQPPQAPPGGMPGAQEPVSNEDLSDLSQSLAALTRGGAGTFGNGSGPGEAIPRAGQG